MDLATSLVVCRLIWTTNILCNKSSNPILLKGVLIFLTLIVRKTVCKDIFSERVGDDYCRQKSNLIRKWKQQLFFSQKYPSTWNFSAHQLNKKLTEENSSSMIAEQHDNETSLLNVYFPWNTSNQQLVGGKTVLKLLRSFWICWVYGNWPVPT